MLTSNTTLGGRYRVEEELGKGSIATVYRALDERTKQKVALKVLWPHLRRDELVAARFRREVDISRRHEHPSVVKILELHESPDHLCLVMEYVPGGNLQDLRRRRGKPLSWSELAPLARDVLDVLEEAHRRGIVHRDLKPKNLLFDADGAVKIADFGLARVSDMVGLTTHTMTLGTPEYMPPEQVTSPLVDGRADLYALGVILFEALSGALPFKALNPADLFLKHAESDPPELPDELDVPDHVREALSVAMATDPMRRFPTARAMARALEGKTRVQPIRPRPRADESQCRTCGAALFEDLTLCLDCGTGPIIEGTPGFSKVYVPRHYKPYTAPVEVEGWDLLYNGLLELLLKQEARPLSFAQKRSLLERLRLFGAGFDDLREDVLEHIPFVVASDLDPDDAENLKHHLMRSALCEVVNRGHRPIVIDDIECMRVAGDSWRLSENHVFPRTIEAGKTTSFIFYVPAHQPVPEVGDLFVESKEDVSALEIIIDPPLAKNDVYLEISRGRPRGLEWSMPFWRWRAGNMLRISAWIAAISAIFLGILLFTFVIILVTNSPIIGLMAILAIGGVIVGALVTFRNHMDHRAHPLAHFGTSPSGSLRRETVLRASRLFAGLQSPRTRELAQAVLFECLAICDNPNLRGQDARSVLAVLWAAIEEGRRIATFERRAGEINLWTTHGEIQRIEHQLSSSETIEESAGLIEEKRSLYQTLDALDEAQREMTLGNARLLSIWAKLAELRAEGERAKLDVLDETSPLKAITDELRIETEAYQAVQFSSAFEIRDFEEQLSGPASLDWIVPERFEVLRELGSGAMARVYLAIDHETHEEVALKVLHPHLRRDTLVIERLRREVNAARRIEHDTVIKMYELVEADDVVFLVMEYLPGEDLKRRLQGGGPLSVAEVIDIGGQLLDGLGAAHGMGIVHGDIKPQNILIDDRNRIKITDFGLARVDNLIGQMSHQMHLGTPEYMAPEVLSSPVVDGRADLYSAGVTLFELLTGHPPLMAHEPSGLLNFLQGQQATDLRSLRPDIPEGLAHSVARAMEPEPEERFSTAEQMKHAIEHVGPLKQDETQGIIAHCPSCSAQLLPAIKSCFECGYKALPIRSHGQGEVALLIPRQSRGPGKSPLKRLSVEDVMKLRGHLAQVANASLPRWFEERAEALPLVVADRLEFNEAKDLADFIATLGLQVELVSGTGSRIKAIAPHQVGASLLMSLPLVMILPLLSCMGLSVLTGFIMALLGGPHPWSTIFGFTLGIEYAPFVFALCLLLQSRKALRPLLSFEAGVSGAPARVPWLTRATEVFRSLDSQRLRALQRRMLRRAAAMRERFMQDKDFSERAVERLNELVFALLDELEDLAILEANVLRIHPGELSDRLEELDEKIARSLDVDETQTFIETRVLIARQLAVSDENHEELLARTLAILRFIGRLDALIDEASRLGTKGSNRREQEALIFAFDFEGELRSSRASSPALVGS